jgi:hypothetical protein
MSFENQALFSRFWDSAACFQKLRLLMTCSKNGAQQTSCNQIKYYNVMSADYYGTSFEYKLISDPNVVSATNIGY